jgi:hypothetical protein
MHVMAVLDAMKKHGHFKDYDRAQKAHDEAKKVAELAEAGLALLDKTSAGTTSKCKKKVLAKAKEAAKEALAKARVNYALVGERIGGWYSVLKVRGNILE